MRSNNKKDNCDNKNSLNEDTLDLSMGSFGSFGSFGTINENDDGEDEDEDNIDNMDDERRVITGAISCHFILCPQEPNVNVLYDILSTKPYKGPNEDDDDEEEEDDDFDFDFENDSKGGDNRREKLDGKNVDLSFESLKSMIAASDNEILSMLKQLNGIFIDNEWRLIDYDYWVDCAQDCLNAINVNSKIINFNRFTIAHLCQLYAVNMFSCFFLSFSLSRTCISASFCFLHC